MVSREHKRAGVLHEKLQLLRSITNSHAPNNASIILDASKYIEELKQKVERLNQDISTTSQNSSDKNPSNMVTVETVEEGFQINVYSRKSCPGLLVFILEALEEIGLNLLDARVSCEHSFQLQAIGKENEEQDESLNAQRVKQKLLHAIQKWSESSEQE